VAEVDARRISQPFEPIDDWCPVGRQMTEPSPNTRRRPCAPDRIKLPGQNIYRSGDNDPRNGYYSRDDERFTVIDAAKAIMDAAEPGPKVDCHHPSLAEIN
jgi:hypothetical protein